MRLDIDGADIRSESDMRALLSRVLARALGEGEFAKIRDVLLRVQSQDEELGWQDRFTVSFE
ncbi:hypothetical protein [Streptomyces sp. DSM 15324]|uniref:hypothetical protein n=1 Tax=Streptomyces sp. DSM 15324 TaxID=1739111 RepID=UPI000748875C|nr:hypothetical protein [Streptomyces sp. DSM 15324]KUO11533.1 hypothetical protein AQJ58_13965 [Streptomyces sp. DSM 15324]